MYKSIDRGIPPHTGDNSRNRQEASGIKREVANVGAGSPELLQEQPCQKAKAQKR